MSVAKCVNLCCKVCDEHSAAKCVNDAGLSRSLVARYLRSWFQGTSGVSDLSVQVRCARQQYIPHAHAVLLDVELAAIVATHMKPAPCRVPSLALSHLGHVHCTPVFVTFW